MQPLCGEHLDHGVPAPLEHGGGIDVSISGCRAMLGDCTCAQTVVLFLELGYSMREAGESGLSPTSRVLGRNATPVCLGLLVLLG